MKKILLSICLSVVLPSLCSCSLIDDHISDCSSNRTIDCSLHAQENIDSVLSSQIHGNGAQAVLGSLSAYYDGLLNPSVRSVSMTFSDALSGDSLTTVSRDMQGKSATFSIDLPSGSMSCVAETSQPMFTGRVLMPQGVDHHTLNLYPVGAQVAVVASVDSSITSVSMSVEGCATAFNAMDSTYSFNSGTPVPLTFLPSASVASWQTFTAGVLPSAEGTPWRITIFATTASGSVTRTVLTIGNRLLPGDIRVLQVSIGSNGATQTTSADVGATVTLDWKDGGHYNPDM